MLEHSGGPPVRDPEAKLYQMIPVQRQQLMVHMTLPLTKLLIHIIAQVVLLLNVSARYQGPSLLLLGRLFTKVIQNFDIVEQKGYQILLK